MQQLNEIVKQYLQMDTNYALMITGDWGVGKTHYFKHTLKKEISETPVFSDNAKKYKPILVSLFGLKSVEEIQSEIFLCLYPKFKLGAAIGKALARGVLHLRGIGEYSKYIDEIDVSKVTSINFDELVICFDDLERKSEDLKIEELIGYINSLVENENVKIILIANEEKIEDSNYKKLKEKTVSNTIEFIQDLSNSYDSILNEKFNVFPLYKTFLETNKDFILEIFSKKSNNLRTLIFALSHFQYIYSEVNKHLFCDDNLKDNQDEILLNLLKFTIAISNEYKAGNISFKSREGLDDHPELSLFLLNRKKKEETEKSYLGTFMEDYYENENFGFYNSVYGYITGGTVFKYSSLLEDLKRYYHIEDNTIQPQYKILNKLSYPHFFSLYDRDYLDLTKEMLGYAYQGSYGIMDYLTVFYYATRFENPLKLNLNKLEKDIIRGMLKGGEKYNYLGASIENYLSIQPDIEHFEYKKRVRDAILDLNKKIHLKNKKNEALELEKLCYNNFMEFFRKVLNRHEAIYYEPYFSKFNANKFYTFFLNSEPNQRREILLFFSGRYDNPSVHLKEDLAFLTKLKERVEKKCKQLAGKNISGAVFAELNKHLQESIERLNAITQ